MNTKQLKLNYKTAGWFFALFVLGLFVYYFFTNLEDFAALKDINPLILVAILALNIGVLFINGVLMNLFIKPFGKTMPLADAFKISLLSSIGNYITPFRGGLAVRAVVLKRQHKLPYSNFLASIAGYYAVLLLASCVLAAVSLLVIQDFDLDRHGLITLAFLITAILGVIIAFLSKLTILTYFASRFSRKLSKIVDEVVRAWQQLTSQKQYFLWFFIFSIFMVLTSVALTILEASALNIPLSIPQAVLYGSVASISLIISITPGAIGVRESLLITLSTSLNLSNAELIRISIIDRVLVFVMLGVAGIALQVITKGRGRKQTV